MVALVRAGRKPSELAQEFGCHHTSILSWVRLAGKVHEVATNPSCALSAGERQELIALRRQLRHVQMERDSLVGPSDVPASEGQ